MQRLASFLVEHAGAPLLIVGNFNNVCNPSMDCLFFGQLQELGLETCGYYAISSLGSNLVAQSLSRIDLLLGFYTISPRISDMHYSVRGLWDSSALTVTIHMNCALKKPSRCVNPFWLRVLLQGDYILHLPEFFSGDCSSFSPQSSGKPWKTT